MTVAPVANMMVPAERPPVHDVVVFEQATTKPLTMVLPTAAAVQFVALIYVMQLALLATQRFVAGETAPVVVK